MKGEAVLEIALCAAGAVLGYAAGYLARGRREAVGALPVAVPVAPAAPAVADVEQPAPDVEPADVATEQPAAPDAPEPDAPAPTDPADALRTAREVLDVADLLGNPELARRLAEAVVLLPGVTEIRPRPGDAFEPREHEWVAARPTEDPGRWDTVADLRAPGAAAAGRLLRPAHVVVFEPLEES
ncbi:nucleotide exchange factor GrpE [Kitasatospora sp. LaBMicrA B282]|uniref:nucleotide exchange factor GrpE n=1 Tax=Kitasatospora sp. LaBMicrA B282 TaxID=3420949 RepID=UPI003D109149